jgi:hypothetical protein
VITRSAQWVKKPAEQKKMLPLTSEPALGAPIVSPDVKQRLARGGI